MFIHPYLYTYIYLSFCPSSYIIITNQSMSVNQAVSQAISLPHLPTCLCTSLLTTYTCITSWKQEATPPSTWHLESGGQGMTRDSRPCSVAMQLTSALQARHVVPASRQVPAWPSGYTKFSQAMHACVDI